MKLRSPWLLSGTGKLLARVCQALVSTLDFRAVSCDPSIDPKLVSTGQRFLYVTWHECILVGLPLRAHCDLLGIASEHRDGELLNRAAQCLGWSMVRGSSSQGATGALKELLREKRRHLNITPDGPRGPRRTMAPGAIFLASKARLPIVCCTYGFDRPWRLNSWDRCIIPKPFSRARAIYSGPITVPERLDKDDLERYRKSIENLMNQLTTEAEQWSLSGASVPTEYRLRQNSIDPRVLDDGNALQTPLSANALSCIAGLSSVNEHEAIGRVA